MLLASNIHSHIAANFCQYHQAEVLEGSSDTDKVKDETFGRIFPRSSTRQGEEFSPFLRAFRGRDKEFLGILAFSSAILRTRLLILVFRGQGQDEARNFASFLGHFKVQTRTSRTSDGSPPSFKEFIFHAISLTMAFNFEGP